jgi:hypothetical protein
MCQNPGKAEPAGIRDQFSLSWVPDRVRKLAALTQALITLGSVDLPELRKYPHLSRLEHPEQD